MNLDAAKSLMKKGATLAFAAKQIGVSPGDLDLALWAALPRGRVKGGVYRSEEFRRRSSERMRTIMANPDLKAKMKRGRQKRAASRFERAGMCWAEINEAKRLNLIKRIPIGEAVEIILRSRRET
jgi:hypothetical protein